MRKFVFFGLAAGLVMFGIAVVEAAPAFPPEAEAREARLIAKLKPQAHAWIRQEAMREAASNTVSEGVASQAVRSAGPGLNLSGMSVEDAVFLMFMIIARDAREDMRQMLLEMEETRRNREAQRQASTTQKEASASMREQASQGYEALQAHIKIPRSTALDEYLSSQGVSYGSLGYMSDEQQFKLQRALDRQVKAMKAISIVERPKVDPKYLQPDVERPKVDPKYNRTDVERPKVDPKRAFPFGSSGGGNSTETIAPGARPRQSGTGGAFGELEREADGVRR